MNYNACTFFGHRDCSESVFETLYNNIKKLIIEQNVTLFYVGCNGSYDYFVRKALEKLCHEFKHIRYYVVISYLQEAKKLPGENNTLYPEGIENIPYRYAISWKNKWMINKCNYVLCYVNHTFGGAAKFYEYAIRKNKFVINLADKL